MRKNNISRRLILLIFVFSLVIPSFFACQDADNIVSDEFNGFFDSPSFITAVSISVPSRALISSDASYGHVVEITGEKDIKAVADFFTSNVSFKKYSNKNYEKDFSLIFNGFEFKFRKGDEIYGCTLAENGHIYITVNETYFRSENAYSYDAMSELYELFSAKYSKYAPKAFVYKYNIFTKLTAYESVYIGLGNAEYNPIHSSVGVAIPLTKDSLIVEKTVDIFSNFTPNFKVCNEDDITEHCDEGYFVLIECEDFKLNFGILGNGQIFIFDEHAHYISKNALSQDKINELAEIFLN